MRSHDEALGRPTLSIVVPLYNEAAGVGELVEEIARVMLRTRETYEIILVDDGSTDGTWAAIQRAQSYSPAVRGLSLLRNFGHQGALFAGLSHASGRAVVTMDGDLQHPPDLIPTLLSAWREGYKVVNTIRSDSEDTGWLKRTTSRAFYRVFSVLSGLTLEPGSSDFRLLDEEIVEIVLALRDPALFLRGAVQWVGCPAAEIAFKAGVRRTGSPKFNLRKMFALATDGLISFSSIPLKLGIWLGLATSLLAFTEIGYILVQHSRGETVPGWASVVTVMSFMFGVLFILLGILGAYLAKVYDAVKQRPAFLAGERSGWPTAGSSRRSTGRSIGRVA